VAAVLQVIDQSSDVDFEILYREALFQLQKLLHTWAESTRFKAIKLILYRASPVRSQPDLVDLVWLTGRASDNR